MSRTWSGTHCSEAFARITSKGPASVHRAMSACSNLASGSRSRAAASMSAELSTPVTAAAGKRAARSSVELPGPQPRSTAAWTSAVGMRATSSRAGRLRSSSKRRYSAADQSRSAAALRTCRP